MFTNWRLLTLTKFFLDQYGCAKNQVDGELIISRLENLGLVYTEQEEEADLIIINSCGFIESAKQESLNALLQANESFPKAKILLAGCLAERYAEVFAEELPEADGIVGNGDLVAIDNAVQQLLLGKRPVIKPLQKGVCCGERNKLLSFPGSAYVKITEGCDNRCSFCAIPLIRGNLRSRLEEDILEEIKSLLKQGIFEINLVGQDSAAYGMDGISPHNPEIWQEFDGLHEKESPLASLLKKISQLQGNFWIRILYIHPDHFPLDILPVIAQDKRLLPYFDIPFQSGSDKIIKSMNRIGNSASYINLVKKIRHSLEKTNYKNIALRTTFLAGFPGETDKDAKATEDFLNQIKPDWSGTFTYSQEEDTPASQMEKQISSKIATKRAKNLEKLQGQITSKALLKRSGQTYQVLIEEVIEGGDGEGTGLAIGRAWFQAPEVDGAVVIRYDLDTTPTEKILPGKVVSVQIVGSSGVDLTGDLV